MSDTFEHDGQAEPVRPQNLRMTETVHIADPRTGAVSVLREGQGVPDWAVDLLPPGLAEDAAGSLPASMTGGLLPPAAPHTDDD